MNRESFQCKVFETRKEARKHGAGGIWYEWKGEGRNFPDDVKSVWLYTPYNDCDGKTFNVAGEWHVSEKNHGGAQWKLSGTYDKPTLHPSLHWKLVWHGWLRDGHMKSC